jgi:hypothetical protein
MAVSTITEERNKRKRSDTLIDMDLPPRSEARSISPLWHIEVSAALKINPSFAEH